jgi:HEAT repeat protein
MASLNRSVGAGLLVVACAAGGVRPHAALAWSGSTERTDTAVGAPDDPPKAPAEDPAVEKAQVEKAQAERVQVEEALTNLASHDEDTLYRAMTVVSRRRVLEAVPGLLKVLATHEKPFTRQAAASTLGDLRACDAVPALADALRDRAGTVAQTANKSLRLITGHDLGLDPLARPGERTRARGAMLEWWARNETKVRERCALERALYLLDGADAAAIAAAIPVVVARKAADATPKLVRILAKHADAATRSSAATALGALHACDGVLPLADALRDADDGVARAAKAALVEITGFDVPLAEGANAEEREKARAEMLAWWTTHEPEVRARLKAAK